MCIRDSDEAFRGFLQEKYGSLKELNRSWGTVFWNQTYSDWQQVHIPANVPHNTDNPHQKLDFYRFISASACSYAKMQSLSLIHISWVPSQFVQQLALGIGGGDTYNAIMNGEEVWNNEVYVEAATDFQEMVNNGWFSEGMLAMSYDEAIMEFEAEEAGMYYMASWDASGFVVDSCPIKDSVGSFNIPGKTEAGQNCVVGSADTAYALSAECSNPEACIAFLKYITSQDWQYRDLMTNAKIPTVKPVSYTHLPWNIMAPGRRRIRKC